MKQFTKDLAHLINKHSLESQSDTPDFILAEYLTESLISYNRACCKREVFFGRKTSEKNLANSTATPVQHLKAEIADVLDRVEAVGGWEFSNTGYWSELRQLSAVE